MNIFIFSNLINEKCLIVILIVISFIIGEVVDHLYVSFLIFYWFIFSYDFEIILCILGSWLFAYKMNCKFFIPQLILFFFFPIRNSVHGSCAIQLFYIFEYSYLLGKKGSVNILQVSLRYL